MDEVVEPGQKRSFNLAARNVKQEIINSYWKWKEKSDELIQGISDRFKKYFLRNR